MSISVAMDKGKEVMRLGSAERKVVKSARGATKLSKQYGSVPVFAERVVSVGGE